MTTQKWDMEREVNECIVCGQVISPLDTLLAKLNGAWHKHEQCH